MPQPPPITVRRIQFRRDVTEQWEQYNPVLAAGEPAVDLTARVLKIGDGSTPWDELPGRSVDFGDSGGEGGGGELEFRLTATNLQWRYVGEQFWRNAVSLAPFRMKVIEQPTPSAVWTLAHEWGNDYPLVQIEDSAHNVVHGKIEYEPNLVTVRFSSAFSGVARLRN